MSLGLTYGTSTENITAFVEGVRGILADTEEVNQDNAEVHFLLDRPAWT